jgi:hypothetical protein
MTTPKSNGSRDPIFAIKPPVAAPRHRRGKNDPPMPPAENVKIMAMVLRSSKSRRLKKVS